MSESAFATGPIPGMSLTGAKRNVPWENPPMLASVEDAIAYYTDKLLDPETEDKILATLEAKVSIENVAETIITSSAMNGIHSLDVGVLINPVVRELLMLVADSADTPYVESYKKLQKEKMIPRSVAREIAKRAMTEPTEPMTQGAAPVGEAEIPVEYRGLMAPVNAPSPMAPATNTNI